MENCSVSPTRHGNHSFLVTVPEDFGHEQKQLGEGGEAVVGVQKSWELELGHGKKQGVRTPIFSADGQWMAFIRNCFACIAFSTACYPLKNY